MPLHPILLEKLNESTHPSQALRFTRRDAKLPEIPGKVHAVIGMRRSGKTTFLRQLQTDLRSALPAERAIYISLEDDRLVNLSVEQLDQLLEEFYRRYPELRRHERVHWYLDEIQLVKDWERFVRRAIESENIEFVVSGSSAQMLGRELHTALRGRGVATTIRPFSFREFLRHRGEEPAAEVDLLPSRERSIVENRFLEYMKEGGFPEAQRLPTAERVELLQGYVDSVLFRDVVERYDVTQVAALRWLVRQCLRNPARSFSIHRFHQDLKAQGHGVSKDALHALFGHLTDAFLMSAVTLSTRSERKRNSNPRKIYPIDPALIAAFHAGGNGNAGHTLECVVMNELERRKANVGYVKTESGFEVDFHARFLDGREEIIQVCADLSTPETLERELRALSEAGHEHPRAVKRLLVLERPNPTLPAIPDVQIQPVYEWLLQGE